MKFEDAPEAAQIEARVEVLEDDMDSLIKDDSEEIDITTTATTHETAKYATKTGGTASSTSWEYYALENDDFESINYGLYSGGNMSTFNFIDFYNSTTPSSVSHIGQVAITALNSYITGTVEVPAGTKYITINNKRLNGETVNIPTIIGVKGVKGAVPELQDQMAEVQAELEKLAGKSVKEGLRIAIIGDSISTRESLKTPEITIQPEDVGVQLGAWVTIYDALPLTIGDKTFTESDIGSYVTFTPTAADIGKRVGTEHIYSGNANVKIWWQYLADLGATMINGTYCSASMSSHEKDIQRLCTSWSWHDQQIRRLGRRIPGTMQREAPDIIIMYRGVNDMTHTPYVSLTNNYFDSPTWTYPTDDNLGGTNYGFKEGVSIWVSKLRKVYPRAQIVFATANTCKRISYSHFPTNNGDYSLPTFSKAIREAADFFGCKTIDFDKDGITFENCYPTYISDSATTPTHPNATGHAVMAVQAITDLDSKLDLFNFTPLNLMGKVDHHIITNLTDVTISNTATVYTGDSFEATLEATDGGIVNSVIITMGGIDITSTAYTPATGIISIANVTGDIIVTASSVPPEQVELTQNLSHATSSASTTLPKNQASTVIITADDGYMIDNITVTMGGTDITADSYVYYTNNAEVRIANVTDDVTITATTTYVNSNYQVLKELYGQSSKAIFTDLTGSDLSRCLTKIYVRTVTDSNAFGIYGDIFCNEAETVFSTGSTTGSTEVTVQSNTEYLINLVDVDQNTSSLEIYAGNDITLSNRLGIGTRSVAPGSVYFTFLGLKSPNSKSYGCTNQAFQYSYMYDSNNNVIHHYIPVKQLSSNTDGIYDIETGTFATFSNQTPTSFVNVTKTLSNVICSAGNKLISNEPAHIVLTAEDGYTIDSVTVTMGDADITDSSYEYYANNAEINITNVTGDITITASATLVNASYRVMKELYGKSSKAIDTGLAYTDMNRVLYRIKAVAPKDMEGQGFYGYAFANEINDPTLDIIVFAATGSTTTLSQYRITNANAGQKYLVNITNVDTGTATISMYDGNDMEMSTLLGSTQRVHGSVNYNWSWCGMLKSDNRNAYATTNQSLFYGKMYNSGDTLIHNYIPVMNILTGEEGLYDTVADAFKGFVDVTD